MIIGGWVHHHCEIKPCLLGPFARFCGFDPPSSTDQKAVFFVSPKKWAKWRHPKKSQRRSHNPSRFKTQEQWDHWKSHEISGDTLQVLLQFPVPSLRSAPCPLCPLGSGAGTMMEMDVQINADDEDSINAKKTMILAFGQHHLFLFGEVSHIRS